MKKSKSIHNGQGTRVPKKQKLRRPANHHAQRRIKQKPASFDNLLGQGAALWDDEEFDRFQAWLREVRSKPE